MMFDDAFGGKESQPRPVFVKLRGEIGIINLFKVFRIYLRPVIEDREYAFGIFVLIDSEDYPTLFVRGLQCFGCIGKNTDKGVEVLLLGAVDGDIRVFDVDAEFDPVRFEGRADDR